MFKCGQRRNVNCEGASEARDLPELESVFRAALAREAMRHKWWPGCKAWLAPRSRADPRIEGAHDPPKFGAMAQVYAELRPEICAAQRLSGGASAS